MLCPAVPPCAQALLAFRFLVGLGIPAATVAFNMVLEFTPTRQRGLFAVAIEGEQQACCSKLCVLHVNAQTEPMPPPPPWPPAGFWTIGTVAQAALAYALLNSHGWRVLIAVSTVPYGVLLLLLPLVPESPRYLLVKGRVDAAERVLGRVVKVCRRQLPEGHLQPLLAQQEAVANEQPEEVPTSKAGA